MEYKSNNNVVYCCKYHVVWCPKYRRKVLVGTTAERLKELIIQRCSEIDAEIIEKEIMPDHEHMLMEVDPQYGINRAVRRSAAHGAQLYGESPEWGLVVANH